MKKRSKRRVKEPKLRLIARSERVASAILPFDLRPWRAVPHRSFLADYLNALARFESDKVELTEMAERFGVSLRSHKWLARHNADGMKGLVDRSRAPLHIPHRTTEQVAERVIAFRRRFPHMGPRKIVARLAELHPDIDGPAPSTIGDILRRANLVLPRKRRSPPAHPLRVRSEPVEPNDLMTVDYKGQFLLSNHRFLTPVSSARGAVHRFVTCDNLYHGRLGKSSCMNGLPSLFVSYST
jgi:Homeodomain-like domain